MIFNPNTGRDSLGDSPPRFIKTMPPKDTIFSNGPCEISFAPLANLTESHPLGEVIADSLSILEADEADDAPTASIPALTTGRHKFTVGIPNIDRDTIEKLLGCAIDRKPGVFSVIVQKGKEYIHRPHNLKYPNKKRARRIWKKWRRRYGADYPEQMVSSNCTMTTEWRGNDFIYKIEAHKTEAQ